METAPVIPGYEGYFLEGGGTGVCVLHGGMTSPHTMRGLAEHLAGRGFSVSVPLLAGHGTNVEMLNRTQWPEIAASAREGIDALDRHGCTRRFVVGHSLGAALALYAAATFENIHAVVSISAPVYLPFKETFLLRIAARFIPYAPRDFQDVSDYQEHRALYDRYDKLPLRFFNHLMREGRRNRELLNSIRCPALIIHGGKDTAVPFRNAEIIMEHVRSERKELWLLENEGHGPLWYDAKDACFARISEFLLSIG